MQDSIAYVPLDQRPLATVLIARACLHAIEPLGCGVAKAIEAVDALGDWLDGVPRDARSMSHLLYDDNGEGIFAHEYETQNTPAHGPWITLSGALAYGTWRVAKETNAPIPSEVTEVDEASFNEMLEAWGEVSERTSLIALAAAQIDGHPGKKLLVDLLAR